MSKRTYAAVLEPASEGFGIYFPDLPGCVSFSATADEAAPQAEAALSLHLEGMAEDGEPFPEPTSLDMLWREHRPALMMPITVETPDEAERVNVYLPKSLLERVDRFAARAGVNRSNFFATAARRYMGETSES